MPCGCRCWVVTRAMSGMEQGTTVPDTRVTHFWDGDRLVGNSLPITWMAMMELPGTLIIPIAQGRKRQIGIDNAFSCHHATDRDCQLI